MIYLTQSRAAWGSDGFNEVFRKELESVSTDELPLQEGLSLGSAVSGEPFRAMVISITEEPETVRVKAGIFYSGIIAGCSCSDDPTPTDLQAEYCEVECLLNTTTGETAITLIDG